MTRIARRGKNSMSRAVLLVFVSFLVGALLVAHPSKLPLAQAQELGSTDSVNFGDCSFRQGSGAARGYANSICWLDLSGLESSSNGGYVTKKVGDYTLQFKVAVSGNANIEARKNATDEKAIFGKVSEGTQVFQRNSSSTTNDVLQATGPSANRPTGRENMFAQIELSDISYKDSAGRPVENFRLLLADAEYTAVSGGGEMIAVDASRNGTAINTEALGRITPGNPPAIANPLLPWNLACDRGAKAVFGSGTQPIEGGWPGTGENRNFLCYGPWLPYSNSLFGTFVTSTPNPTSYTIRLGSQYEGRQAIALGVGLGRVQVNPEGNAIVQSQYESRLTSTASQASYQVFLKDIASGAMAEVPVPKGRTVAVPRRISNGGILADQYVFKSTLSSASLGFKRYTPVWKCTLTNSDGSSTTYQGAQVNSANGFQVVNDEKAGSSSVTHSGTQNRLINCAVTWEARFKEGALSLSKAVSGNASTFDEVVLRRFQLDYACTAPADFTTAYPDAKLSGSVIVQNGGTDKVALIPQGAQCTISETFLNGDNPPATVEPVRPGKSLVVSVNKTAVATPSAQSVPLTTVAVQENNSVPVNNEYTYRSAAITLSKEILGEPAVDLRTGEESATPESRDYHFTLSCRDTGIQQLIEQPVTLTLTRVNGRVQGSTVLEGIPRNRDCTIRPLTKLDDSQQQTIESGTRVVDLNGETLAPVGENDEYHFRLPDGPDDPETPAAEMHFQTSYSYITRPLTIRKAVSGTASTSEGLQDATYTVNYSCTRPGTSEVTTYPPLTLKVGESKETRDIAAGSACKVWENHPGDTAYAKFDGATVSSSDSGDRVTELTNEEAKTTPVITVRATNPGETNMVTVTNSYTTRLGTVSVSLDVNNTTGIALDGPHTIHYVCGKRNLDVNGQNVSVDLEGDVTLSKGETKQLTLADGTPNAALANDQDGSLGVPYGNTCTFSESFAGVAGLGGVIASSDAADATVTVTQPDNAARITNTFTPAGEGLTVTQRYDGPASLIAPVAYSLRCVAADGATVVVDEQQIRLGAGEEVSFPAALPGATCTLRPESRDDGTRTSVWNDEYPIDVASRAVYLAGEGAQEQRFDPATGERTFVVGTKSTLRLITAYSFREADVNLVKHVAFTNPGLISSSRQDVKRNREFPVTLTCDLPDGTQGTSLPFTLKHDGGDMRNAARHSVAVGARCTVAEGDTTTARGITLTKRINIGGNVNADDKPVTFRVGGNTDVELINTYERQTTNVEVIKEAEMPGAVRAQYAASGLNLQDKLYDHTFTLVCKDPETNENERLGAPAQRVIHGENRTTFTGVPVGADCQLTGDQFGSLHLQMTESSTGDDLEAYLKPSSVDWVVNRTGGSSVKDAALNGDTTTSPTFATVAETETEKNSIILTNHYAYQTAPVTLTKNVVGDAADLALLEDTDSFAFALQCKAIGYSAGALEGDTLVGAVPGRITVGDMTARNGETSTGLTFTSPEGEVPAGSLCEFTENAVSVGAAALSVAPEQAELTQRVGAPGADATDIAFTNTVTRRTTPVRVSLSQSGYFGDRISGEYQARLVCKADNGETVFDTTSTADWRQVPDGTLPLGDQAPQTGGVVDVPVGTQCALTYDAEGALAAQPDLEVVAGDRQPYMQFAVWNGQARIDGPSRTLQDTPVEDVAEKQYSTVFSVPAEAPSTSTQLVVAAEAYRPRAYVDLTMTKTSEGAAGEGNTFTFTQACNTTGETFTLRAGDSVTIPRVPVDSDCAVTETDDGNPSAESNLSFARATGDDGGIFLGLDPEVHAKVAPTEDGTEAHRTGTFRVHPVSSPDDIRIDGNPWAFFAHNRFPGISVDKTIDGIPLSAAAKDTALLGSEANQMVMHYRIANTGAFDLTGVGILEPSLAGRTVTVNGQRLTVGVDGSIPAGACGVSDPLAPEKSVSCEVVVDISGEPRAETYTYRGKVTVTADAGLAGNVADSSEYGAVRVSALLDMLLPETGQQTLVLFLLLGLALFGVGAWRVSRRDDDRDDGRGAHGNGDTEGGELVEV